MLTGIQANRSSGYTTSSILAWIILICVLLLLIQFFIADEFINRAHSDPRVISGSKNQAHIGVPHNLGAAVDPLRYPTVAPEIMPARLNEVRRISSAENVMRLIKSGE